MPSLKRYPLILAGVLTLLMSVQLLSAILHLSGTFGEVKIFPWVKLCTLRWLCLAFVLGNLLVRGDFGWISRYGVVRALVVSGGHAVLGFVSLACLATVDRPTDPASPALNLLTVLMVVVVPLVIIGLLAARTWVYDLTAMPS